MATAFCRLFRKIRNKNGFIPRYSFLSCSVRRNFLSEAYQCREAWERRLEQPLLQRLNLDEMYYEIDRKFQEEGKASAVDIDLFANRVTDDTHLEELEDLIHKLRLSPNTAHTLQSTPHAVIRTFMALGKTDNLLRILNDRLNYGIFPDDYCLNLMLDRFLKDSNYRDAAKVAILQMLQEDWNSPLTTHLSLYACHMYLNHPQPEPWDTEPIIEPEDSKEEIKVRVKYLRNPFFDDHFDLRDPQHLIGKTLATSGRKLSDSVGSTYEVAGWALYNKWDRARTLLENYLAKSQKPVVFKDGVRIFEEALEKFPAAEDNTKEQLQDEFSILFKKMKDAGLILDDDLHQTLEDKVKQVVSEHESSIMQKQVQLYSDWQKIREDELQKQLNEYNRQERLKKVEEKKKELAAREEVLFFFENKEKLEMLLPDEDEVPQETVKQKKKEETDDENYVPPEVRKNLA